MNTRFLFKLNRIYKWQGTVLGQNKYAHKGIYDMDETDKLAQPRCRSECFCNINMANINTLKVV